ncbi:MAG: hypothetical protein MJK14_12285 [Rivularia sp. ALOHA_DT_140]|nr:hypothetical protein [Rivularia sp. ALOHA_DT_140]
MDAKVKSSQLQSRLKRMRMSVILQALKILLGIAEQVTELIADSDIPESEQPEVRRQVDQAVEKLYRANSLIAIAPAREVEE